MTLNEDTFQRLRVGDKLQWVLPSDVFHGLYSRIARQTKVVVVSTEQSRQYSTFEYKCTDDNGDLLIGQVWYVNSSPFGAWEWKNYNAGELKWFDIWERRGGESWNSLNT